MDLASELERLAKLHAAGSLTSEEFAKAKDLLISGRGCINFPTRYVRRQSARKFCGLPLWSIAIGPDLEHGEWRGHARGIFALGDIATGWFACGGFARGFVALGGMAIGLFTFGGCSLGLLLAFGGCAIGGVAIGGLAVGAVALGGGAVGYYAMGGGAFGAHTLSAQHRDPAAIEFFRQFLPFLGNLLPR